MIANLSEVRPFEIKTELQVGATKLKRNWFTAIKIKQCYKWLSPKNWFNSLSDIDINLSEFACKKISKKIK